MFQTEASMSSMPIVSQAAVAAGIPARYLYWTGRSGRRYLFTCMSDAAASGLESGVAIAVSGEHIAWIGEVAALAHRSSGTDARGADIYVHLLAKDASARRAVIWDLRPAESACHLPLAA